MEMTISKNWRFHPGDAPEAFRKDFDDADWRSVTLPHDWAVEGEFSRKNSSGTGYLQGGTGWYRGTFYLPEEAKGKIITLHFDGVYKNSRVWCNSYYLGQRPNGYIGFSYDVTHAACFGDTPNEISVRVEHEDISDSRWFTGSGMTRTVHVSVEDPLRFAGDGVVFDVRTACADSAKMAVRCTLVNGRQTEEDCTLRVRLLDKNGVTKSEYFAAVKLAAGQTADTAVELVMTDPKLWSPETPYLYTLLCELETPAGVAAERRVPVGLRTFRFDAGHGFFLNGQSRKLKGVCIHHDGGCLGAAMHKVVWQRRLEALKEMGCNAIRMSHNPHMPALFDLCDELGFLVIDEAFDEWEGCKNKWSTGHNVYPPKHQGYALDFPQWGETDLRALIRRDRNHPSVILWSIGNEIDYPNDPYCHPSFQTTTGNNDANKPAAEREYNPARPNMERLAPIARRLAAIVKQEDATRPVTAAVAFPELSSYLGYLEPLDVVGYNYKEQYYQGDHKRFPDKPFLGSENSHSLEAWKAVRDTEYIAGQFLWTGIDFLGEAHGWPIHGSAAGHLTLAGYPKGEYWFRRALWAEKPVCALVTARPGGELARAWCYTPGEEVLVRCCTNQSKAELFVDGASCGVKPLLDETGVIEWTVPFAAGPLTVRAEGCADTLLPTGRAVSLKMAPWGKPGLLADGEDIAQIEVQLLDGAGNETQGEELLHVSLEGPATLLGIENGDLADNTAYSAPYRRACRGKLLIYLRAGEQNGSAKLTVQGDCVGSHTLLLPVGENG